MVAQIGKFKNKQKNTQNIRNVTYVVHLMYNINPLNSLLKGCSKVHITPAERRLKLSSV